MLLSWDWPVAVLAVVVFHLVFPQGVCYEIAREVFEVSISVLAIVFSIFFAALAVLVTSGDNEFVRFLHKDGSYQQLAWSFKVTLLLLFSALLASIVLFITVLPPTTHEILGTYPRPIMLVYCFFVLYSLLAALQSSLDAVRYAELRARFIEILDTDE